MASLTKTRHSKTPGAGVAGGGGVLFKKDNHLNYCLSTNQTGNSTGGILLCGEVRGVNKESVTHQERVVRGTYALRGRQGSQPHNPPP